MRGSQASRNSLRPRRSLYDRLANANAATMPGDAAGPYATAHDQPLVVRRAPPWKWALVGAALVLGAITLGLSQLQAPSARVPPPAAPTVEPAVAKPVVPAAPAQAAEVVPAEPQTLALEVTAKPPQALIKLDGESIGRGTAARKMTADGAEHTLELSAPGHRTMAVKFKDTPPANSFTLEKLGAPRPLAVSVPIAAEPPAAKPAPEASQPPAPTPAANQRYGTNGAAILR